MVFPAKRDWSWGTAMVLIPWGLSPLLNSVLTGRSMAEPQFSLLVFLLACMSAGGLGMLWSFLDSRYEVNESELVVRSGPFRRTLRLGGIFEVISTQNGSLCGMAWSRDVLTIRFYMNWNRVAGDSIEISPRDKAGFVTAIADRCAQLERFGAGLKQTKRRTEAAIFAIRAAGWRSTD